jgi:hypothetical protein
MTISGEERAALGTFHWPNGTRCNNDGEDWPCTVHRLLDAYAEAVNFTTVWQEVLPYTPDDYGFTMQCVEAEAAADLFRAVGDENMAESILDAHAVYDTEEDQHHERGEAVQRRRADSERRASGGDPVPGS